MLHTTSRLLEEEKLRSEELERRLADATERWKLVNQARIQAQADSGRLTEELRLYKMQLDSAQQQIIRANDLVAQSDKDKAQAEDVAEKAKNLARRLQEEKLMRQAKDEGLRMGREEGKREGMKVGYERGFQEAYDQAREEAMQNLDKWIADGGFAGEGGRYPPRDELEYEEEEEEEEGEDVLDREEMEEERMYEQQQQQRRQQQPPPPAAVQRAREMSMPPLQQHPHQRRSTVGPGLRSMPDPQVRRSMTVPSQRTMTMPQPQVVPRHNRQGSILNRLRTRLNGGARDTDRNVEINVNAPDVGVIVDERPDRTTATPLAMSTQLGHMRAGSPMVGMPTPNYHPDPRDVPPIAMPQTPRTPRTPSHHPRVEIPPDGYIPEADADGSIGLPPPHELAKPPPTPREGRSPFMGGARSLAGGQQAPAPPPKEPVSRDFYYEGHAGVGAGGSTPRAYAAQMYQRSIPESVASEATSMLSILTPPNMKGAAAAGAPRLSAIQEMENSPNDRNVGRRLSREQVASAGRPISRASGRSGRGFQEEFSDHRQRIADELKDPDYVSTGHGTPRRSETVCVFWGPSFRTMLMFSFLVIDDASFGTFQLFVWAPSSFTYYDACASGGWVTSRSAIHSTSTRLCELGRSVFGYTIVRRWSW